jgi:hypothetical protein
MEAAAAPGVPRQGKADDPQQAALIRALEKAHEREARRRTGDS